MMSRSAGRLGLLAALALILLLWAPAARAAVEIGFHSREFGRTFPHAFIVLSGTLESTGERIDANYGFTVRNRIGPSVLLGSVQGQVVSEGPEEVARGSRHFALTLSDEEYRRVMAVVDRWRTLPQPSYHLDRRNCVFFVAEIAAALGLGAEPVAGLMRRPGAFLDRVHRDNGAMLAFRARRSAPAAAAATR